MARKDVVVFFCDGICSGDIQLKKCKPLGHVFFVADGTAVTLTFEDPGVFIPRTRTISIPANTFVKKKLANVTGKFKYTVVCGSCPSGADDLEMILEL